MILPCGGPAKVAGQALGARLASSDTRIPSVAGPEDSYRIIARPLLRQTRSPAVPPEEARNTEHLSSSWHRLACQPFQRALSNPFMTLSLAGCVLPERGKGRASRNLASRRESLDRVLSSFGAMLSPPSIRAQDGHIRQRRDRMRHYDGTMEASPAASGFESVRPIRRATPSLPSRAAWCDTYDPEPSWVSPICWPRCQGPLSTGTTAIRHHRGA